MLTKAGISLPSVIYWSTGHFFLNQIVKEDNYSGEGYILAIFGSAAIPAFMTCLQREPQRLWFFTFFLGVNELALPMAQRLQKKCRMKMHETG